MATVIKEVNFQPYLLLINLNLKGHLWPVATLSSSLALDLNIGLATPQGPLAGGLGAPNLMPVILPCSPHSIQGPWLPFHPAARPLDQQPDRYKDSPWGNRGQKTPPPFFQQHILEKKPRARNHRDEPGLGCKQEGWMRPPCSLFKTE